MVALDWMKLFKIAVILCHIIYTKKIQVECKVRAFDKNR